MKNSLRIVAKQNRSKIIFDKRTKKLFLDNIYSCLDKIFFKGNDLSTAGLYYPMFNEISPFEFIKYFKNNNIIISLPVVNIDTQSMMFKKWNPEEKLRKGLLGNFEPINTTENIMPQVLIVPMLLFDRQLYRLGYGGGYYDRAINQLKKYFYKEKKKFISIGLAYSKQETKSIPYENHDERLDFIITEKEILSRID